MNKYHNTRTVVDGITFDSKAEARRYQELRLLAQAGQIADLVLQPRYELQAAFRTPGGERIRAIEYVGDFGYTENGLRVVEDTKGAVTQEFAIKRKLFLLRFPRVELRVLNARGEDLYASKRKKAA